MIKKILLIFPFITLLWSHDYHNESESLLLKTAMSYSDFSNSKQKSDGMVSLLSLHYKSKKHKIELQQTFSHVNTFQPPSKEDLSVYKSFFRYGYTFTKGQSVNVSFMDISDNLVPTDGGKIYGLGYAYRYSQGLSLFTNQYYSNYDDFSVNQSEIKLHFHKESRGWKNDIKVIGRYINLDNYTNTIFNPKFQGEEAKDNYMNLTLKVHTAYKGYHAGAGVILGERIFAVMNNGFLTQHHAMEFKEGYFLSIGKKIQKFNLFMKYNYAKADELPLNNKDVGVNSYILGLSYRF